MRNFNFRITNRRSIFFLSFLFLTFYSAAFGISPNNGKDSLKTRPSVWGKIKERLYFGGELGASFGTLTAIDLSPIVGYRITDRFSMGLGPIYQYYRLNANTTSGTKYTISSSMYGGKVFARELINEWLYLYSEFDLLNLETFDFYSNKFKRVNVPLLLVGGGYMMPIGESSAFGLNLLWDVIQDPNSPFPPIPIVRGGFIVGL